MTAFSVTSGSAQLKGERWGEGPGVTLLHAGVADRRMWAGQLAALQETYFALAYDRRGFGETIYKDELFAHIDDLEAVLNYLNLETTTLVGCSQGGRVAVDFALANPERVSLLVLIAPAVSGQPSPTDVSAEIEALWEDLEQADEAADIDLINRIEAHLWLDGPTSPEGRVSGKVRELFLNMNGIALRAPELTQEQESPPAFERLAEISVPTLILWGDLDFPHVQARCRHLAKTVPKAQAKIIKGTAHLPNLEQPSKFNAALLSFLDGN